MFAVLTVIFVIIAATPAGFPFEKTVAPKRFYVLHTNRVFHEYDSHVTRNESGYFVLPVDPRNDNVDDTVYKNANSQSYTDENCANEMYCGLPLYNTRWLDWVKSSRWIPSSMPHLPNNTELTFKAKTILTSTKVRFEFSVIGSDRMVLYVEPIPGATVTDWSFNRTPLEENYRMPYFVYWVYLEQEPLEFWIELERDAENWVGPTFKLAVGEHFQYHENEFTTEYKEYLADFPDWVYPTAWIASHESWLF